MPTTTKQIITLTDSAVEQVKVLMAESADPVIGLRVSLSSKGCSGYSYIFEYAKEKRPLEEEVVSQGARVFIDPMAVMFIAGAEMDYEEGLLKSGFTFSNPNETGRCGCGESIAF
ncbi:MAG: Iron-sulfur cluster insertion protein ErpA [Alphaproteobacteria bacterium MarineAlpha3_Bin5]|nr:Fe-S cluster assembly scaffold SufA [Magnetovibrio sp.]PPR78585.1 MAG: Iron-sulfur cluster insertion protein ErpA [Alphaproteobacteria bacterium MarineAlpha3_Bin5]|tara:strand:- start:65 stop:409 length:345 start_codon:yes stop_codon:yes gene_type:complete